MTILALGFITWAGCHNHVIAANSHIIQNTVYSP